MQTDKELLELAAKAAGINFRWNEPCGKVEELSADGWFVGFFEPLTDDGDALRLAVKLKLCIDMNWLSIGSAGDTMCFMPDNQTIMQSHYSDPYAATRRAITRAAAAIGSKL